MHQLWHCDTHESSHYRSVVMAVQRWASLLRPSTLTAARSCSPRRATQPRPSQSTRVGTSTDCIGPRVSRVVPTVPRCPLRTVPPPCIRRAPTAISLSTVCLWHRTYFVLFCDWHESCVVSHRCMSHAGWVHAPLSETSLAGTEQWSSSAIGARLPRQVAAAMSHG